MHFLCAAATTRSSRRTAFNEQLVGRAASMTPSPMHYLQKPAHKTGIACPQAGQVLLRLSWELFSTTMEDFKVLNPRKRPRYSRTADIEVDHKPRHVRRHVNSSSSSSSYVGDFEDDFDDTLPQEDKTTRPQREGRVSKRLVCAPTHARLRTMAAGNCASASPPDPCCASVIPYSSLVSASVTTKKIRAWLEESLRPNVAANASRFLVLTGPPGAGKSTAVRSICSELRCAVEEWKAPTTGYGNDSKPVLRTLVDSMQAFLVGHRYSSLSLQKTDRRLLLLDDLPHALSEQPGYYSQAEEIFAMLKAAALSSLSPVVLVLSDSHRSRARTMQRLGESLLQHSAVSIINVPPVTATSMTRVLREVARVHRLPASTHDIQLFGTHAQGDVRSAISSMLLYFRGHPKLMAYKERGSKGSAKSQRWSKAKQQSQERGPFKTPSLEGPLTLPIGGDVLLDALHAISKILNNKREADGSSKYSTAQLLTSARAEAGPFIGFLHQNFPNFFHLLDDASAVLALMSEADTILQWSQDDAARSLASDCVSYFVTSGFLFHNSKPVRTGWRPIKGPEHRQTHLVASEFVLQLRKQNAADENFLLAGSRVLATELGPYRSIFAAAGGCSACADAAQHNQLQCSTQAVTPIPGFAQMELALGEEDGAIPANNTRLSHDQETAGQAAAVDCGALSLGLNRFEGDFEMDEIEEFGDRD